MVETIRLKTPVLIDGEKVTELAYDIDKISSDQFMEAEARSSSKAVSMGTATSTVAEFDTGFHFYLGVMAVKAENPEYTVEDIERIKGPDLMKIVRVGRNFMTSGAVEGADEESDEPEETDEAEESYRLGLE